jgi:hypothetical protein
MEEDLDSSSDTQDLTQDLMETATKEAEWNKEAVEVPEELLQGIETGWLESKSSGAGTADKAIGGGNRGLLPAKKTVKALQAGKAALSTADAKARDGRLKGAVKRTKRFPTSMTDLTGGGELTSKSSKRDAVESPDSRGVTLKAMQLASPEKLKKGNATKAGEGPGKRMKIVSSASSPSPLKRKLQEGVQRVGNVG